MTFIGRSCVRGRSQSPRYMPPVDGGGWGRWTGVSTHAACESGVAGNVLFSQDYSHKVHLLGTTYKLIYLKASCLWWMVCLDPVFFAICRNCSIYEKVMLKAILAEFTRSGIEEATLCQVSRHVNALCSMERVPHIKMMQVSCVISTLGFLQSSATRSNSYKGSVNVCFQLWTFQETIVSIFIIVYSQLWADCSCVFVLWSLVISQSRSTTSLKVLCLAVYRRLSRQFQQHPVCAWERNSDQIGSLELIWVLLDLSARLGVPVALRFPAHTSYNCCITVIFVLLGVHKCTS